MLNFSGFKVFISSLLSLIVAKCDAKNAELKEQVVSLSADLTTANETITALQSAIAGKDDEQVAALAAQAAEQIAALDQFSTELAEQFNPSAVGDAVAEIVADEDSIETPTEVAEAVEVGTGEVTPETVVEAAIDAVAVVADDFSEGDSVAGE